MKQYVCLSNDPIFDCLIPICYVDPPALGYIHVQDHMKRSLLGHVSEISRVGYKEVLERAPKVEQNHVDDDIEIIIRNHIMNMASQQLK